MGSSRESRVARRPGPCLRSSLALRIPGPLLPGDLEASLESSDGHRSPDSRTADPLTPRSPWCFPFIGLSLLRRFGQTGCG